ncbi:FHA domain-containing protein [Shimia sp. R9_3]|uniref:FHA domain-containing protein n=1 Tax=Shimia sp. R9_3 TaxID=2821113 RepID=UPI001FFE06F0|nr:FHA domain-containing protein [Shimia sp. R9_3]
MRFIRDIINEKTQAAGSGDASALRYPLRLREEDRTDLSPEQELVEEELSSTEAELEHGAFFDAPEATPAADEFEAPSEEPSIDFSSIADALGPQSSMVQGSVQTPAQEPQEAAPVMEGVSAGLSPETVEPDVFPDVEDSVSQPSEMPKLVEADAFNWAAQKPSTAPTPSFAQPAEEEPVRVQQKTAEDVVVPAAESVAEMPSMERSSLDSSRNAVGAHQAPTVSEQKTSAEMAPLQASVTAHRTGGGRGSKGRVKTRLLGFSGPQSTVHDPMTQSREAAPAVQAQFPVGWLVVVDGPGRGASFALFDGLTQIGRGEGQTVRLDFGDNTISRENHAAIAFDGEQRRFFFGHGGKANLVRLNGRPVLSTEDLATNSVIRIGETTLRFVALCGEEFSWVGQDMEVPGHAQFG